MHVDHQTRTRSQQLEVGGPAGIRIESIASSRPAGWIPEPRPDPARALAIGARHPRAIAAGLVAAGVLAFVGPLAVILAFGLPLWLVIGPALLSAISLGGALAVARGSLKALGRAYTQPALEARLLDLATRCGGQLTVPVTAQHLSISLAEAEEALMDLARAGHVDIENDPRSGAVIYVFRHLDAQPQPSPRPIGPS